MFHLRCNREKNLKHNLHCEPGAVKRPLCGTRTKFGFTAKRAPTNDSLGGRKMNIVEEGQRRRCSSAPFCDVSPDRSVVSASLLEIRPGRL